MTLSSSGRHRGQVPSPNAVEPLPVSRSETDREIKRCLKRYIGRQLYRHLEAGPAAA